MRSANLRLFFPKRSLESGTQAKPVSCAAIAEKRRVVHLARSLVRLIEGDPGDFPSGFELKWWRRFARQQNCRAVNSGMVPSRGSYADHGAMVQPDGRSAGQENLSGGKNQLHSERIAQLRCSGQR